MKRIKTVTVSVTICCVLLFSVLGLACKRSYSDISAEPNFLDELLVAELSENNVNLACERISDELDNIPIVVCVTPVEEVEILFGSSQQLVRIKKVFKGESITVGEEVFLTGMCNGLIFWDDYTSIELRFINTLKIGKDYLVFITSEIEQDFESKSVYNVFSDMLAAVFCYDEINNDIVEPYLDGTYVPYRDVANNEFFATSLNGINAILKVKNEQLSNYPI